MGTKQKMISLLLFGLATARFVPYAEFNVHMNAESTMKIRVDMKGKTLIGRGEAEQDGQTGIFEFIIGQNEPGFVSLEALEQFVLNCTWDELNDNVIEHVYERAQDIQAKLNSGGNYYYTPEQAALFFSTDQNGQNVDGFRCIAKWEKKAVTTQKPALTQDKLLDKLKQMLNEQKAKNWQSSEFKEQLNTLFN